MEKKKEINNKSIAVIYCFDNMNQFDKFKHSAITILKQDIDIILIVSEELSKNDLVNNFVSETGIKLVVQADKRIKGMFYWLLSPLLTNYEYYIQLDNDTLISNVSLINLIEKYKSKLKHKSFLGIKSFAWRMEKNKKVIKLYRTNKIDFYSKIRNYINTGVVLINGNRVRSNLINNGYGIEHIVKFFEDTKKNNYRITDQEYLHSFWWKEIGFISVRYNLRTHVLYDLKRFSKREDIILHYNLHSYMDEKWVKFDFINKIKKLSKEEFLEEISEFWASSVERKYKKKKLYKKAISNIYEVLLLMI